MFSTFSNTNPYQRTPSTQNNSGSKPVVHGHVLLNKKLSVRCTDNINANHIADKYSIHRNL